MQLAPAAHARASQARPMTTAAVAAEGTENSGSSGLTTEDALCMEMVVPEVCPGNAFFETPLETPPPNVTQLFYVRIVRGEVEGLLASMFEAEG
eukprot:358192-Chlamydomonas_euryale.AAC.2